MFSAKCKVTPEVYTNQEEMCLRIVAVNEGNKGIYKPKWFDLIEDSHGNKYLHVSVPRISPDFYKALNERTRVTIIKIENELDLTNPRTNKIKAKLIDAEELHNQRLTYIKTFSNKQIKDVT